MQKATLSQKPAILTIDQSTSTSKIVLVSQHGEILQKITKPHRTDSHDGIIVEQDAEEIYENVRTGICEMLTLAKKDNLNIIACGITTQTAAFVLWEKATGRPVTPLIGWQDSRGQKTISDLSDETHALIRERTGSRLSPYVPASKLPVIFKESPDLKARAEKGEILFGTVDAWLIWKLTGGKSHRTDHGNASLTQLMNIYERQWDPDILGALAIPAAILPELTEAGSVFGSVDPKILEQPDQKDSLLQTAAIPITGVLGDSNAALLAQGGFAPGSVKITYGTGASLLINTGRHLPPADTLDSKGLFPVAAWQRDGVPTYVLEGTIIYAGAALTWLKKEGYLRDLSEIEPLAKSVPDSGNVRFTPPLASDDEASSVGISRYFEGLSEKTDPAHIVRAVLEGIASQAATILQSAKMFPANSNSAACQTIAVDGGMAENDLFLQLQADLAGCRVVRRHLHESSALGAAFLAGVTAGLWESLETVSELTKVDRVFEPGASHGDAGDPH